MFIRYFYFVSLLYKSKKGVTRRIFFTVISYLWWDISFLYCFSDIICIFMLLVSLWHLYIYIKYHITSIYCYLIYHILLFKALCNITKNITFYKNEFCNICIIKCKKCIKLHILILAIKQLNNVLGYICWCFSLTDISNRHKKFPHKDSLHLQWTSSYNMMSRFIIFSL